MRYTFRGGGEEEDVAELETVSHPRYLSHFRSCSHRKLYDLYDRTPKGGPSARVRRPRPPDQRLNFLRVLALELEALLPDHTRCTPCASCTRPTYYCEFIKLLYTAIPIYRLRAILLCRLCYYS